PIETRVEGESTEEVELPDWLKEPPPQQLEITQEEKAPDVRMPEWAEEISQRYFGEANKGDKESGAAHPGEDAEKSEESVAKSEIEQPALSSGQIEPMPAIEPPASLAGPPSPAQETVPQSEPSSNQPEREVDYDARLAQARAFRDSNRLSDAFTD